MYGKITRSSLGELTSIVGWALRESPVWANKLHTLMETDMGLAYPISSGRAEQRNNDFVSTSLWEKGFPPALTLKARQVSSSQHIPADF